MSVKEYVAERKEHLKEIVKGKKDIKLVVVQVGDNPASNSYIKGKLADCTEVGIHAGLMKFSEDEIKSTEDLVDIVNFLNREESCTGIIVQLPLPPYIDIEAVQLSIDPSKDVDGFHPMSHFTPCTPLGVINYLKDLNYSFEGKKALVIGRSDIVGKPLAQLLTDLNCTVTLAHSKTPFGALTDYIENSDIVFTAINKIEYFGIDFAPFFEKVPTVIDIGLGRNEQDKLRGNLSAELVDHLREHNSFVVSGTGGVGLLTRLQLLANTIEAQKEFKQKDKYKAIITVEVEAEDLMSVKNVTGLIYARLNNSCMRNIKSCHIKDLYEKDGEYIDSDEEEIEV